MCGDTAVGRGLGWDRHDRRRWGPMSGAGGLSGKLLWEEGRRQRRRRRRTRRPRLPHRGSTCTGARGRSSLRCRGGRLWGARTTACLRWTSSGTAWRGEGTVVRPVRGGSRRTPNGLRRTLPSSLPGTSLVPELPHMASRLISLLLDLSRLNPPFLTILPLSRLRPHRQMPATTATFAVHNNTQLNVHPPLQPVEFTECMCE